MTKHWDKHMGNAFTLCLALSDSILSSVEIGTEGWLAGKELIFLSLSYLCRQGPCSGLFLGWVQKERFWKVSMCNQQVFLGTHRMELIHNGTRFRKVVESLCTEHSSFSFQIMWCFFSGVAGGGQSSGSLVCKEPSFWRHPRQGDQNRVTICTTPSSYATMHFVFEGYARHCNSP